MRMFLFPLWFMPFSHGRLYGGPCPKNLPTHIPFPNTFGLSVLYYLPVDSTVNHLFYPTQDHNIAKLFVGIQFIDSYFYLYKYLNITLYCDTEVVEMGKEGFYENHEILLKSDPIRVTECGPDWQMYQVFQKGMFYILWGCRDLHSEGQHEQGAWILGDRNLTGNIGLPLPQELIEAFNFSQIQARDFRRTLQISPPEFLTIDQFCANNCKYQKDYNSSGYYIPRIFVLLTILAVIMAWQIMLKNRSSRVHSLGNG